MSVSNSRAISIALKHDSEAMQANPKDIFGYWNYGERWPKLNELTGGGQENVYTVFVSRPKIGKSMFWSGVVPAIAQQAKSVNKVVRIVTLETTMKAYQRRMAAMLGAIKNPLAIRRGRLSDEEVADYDKALKILAKLPIEYLSNERIVTNNGFLTEEETMIEGGSTISMRDIWDFVKQPDTFMWIVDHTGLISERGMGIKDRTDTIADKLASLANRYVGGVAISHLNRASVGGGIPSIENIANSDKQGQNAGAIYLLTRPYKESRTLTADDYAIMDAKQGDEGLIRFHSRDEGSGSVVVFWSDIYASFSELEKTERDLRMPGQH